MAQENVVKADDKSEYRVDAINSLKVMLIGDIAMVGSFVTPEYLSVQGPIKDAIFASGACLMALGLNAAKNTIRDDYRRMKAKAPITIVITEDRFKDTAPESIDTEVVYADFTPSGGKPPMAA